MKIDYFGNVTIHIDVLLGLFILTIMLSVACTLAANYDKGFIQWFKDNL